MEKGKSDQDDHVVRKLNRQISNSTTRNPYAGEPFRSGGGASPSLDPILSDEAKNSTSSNLSDPSNTQDVKCPLVQEANSGNHRRASTMTAGQDALNLPDDRSLASAFKAMSFKKRIEFDLTIPSFEHNPASFRYAVLHNSEHLNKSSSMPESSEMPIRMPTMPNGVDLPNLEAKGYSSFITRDDSSMCNRTLDGHCDASSCKLNFCAPRYQTPNSVLACHNEQWQSYTGYPSDMPVNPGKQTFSSPGVLAQGFQLPTTFLNQDYVDAPSHAYASYCQQNQPNVGWCDFEDERNYINNSQYLYFQQLENQHLEGHVQRGRNSATGHLSGCSTQPYFHMPIPHQAGLAYPNSYESDDVANSRCNQLYHILPSRNHGRYHRNGYPSFSNSSVVPQRLKLSSHSGSTVSSHGDQVPDFFCKLTSHGVNPLRTSIGSHQLPKHADNTSRMFPDDGANSYNGWRDGSLNLGIQRSLSSSSDGSDQRHDPESSHLQYDSLDNLSGRIHMLAKDLCGHCFLLKTLDKRERGNVDKIFVEIISHVAELMIHPIAHHLIKKLVEVCTEQQLTHITDKISEHTDQLPRICCDQHGTSVVQKIIKTVKSPELYFKIAEALKPGILSLMKNINGSQVAQYCLRYLPPESKEFLFDVAVANCIELARDRQGCCVIQKCLSDLEGEQKNDLLFKVTSKAHALSQDPSGNYVVQLILDQQIPWATSRILDQLEGHYGTLSVQRYSSNVVEKCLKLARDDRCDNIIRELISDPCFVQISQDPFGNYVVQTARRACKGELIIAFLEAIRPHIAELRASSFGRKVLSKTYHNG
ncbi:pumilio homolog 3 [Musa acuminata AAA Group]|uniref:pumilio homolog 3 n=1 Tax=Musa acuminata AAA Group TaxID=214697 RepID=UPI0031D051BC